MSKSKSGMVLGESLKKICQHGNGARDIAGCYRLGGIVADAAFAANEQYRHRANRRNRRSVMPGTAGKSENFDALSTDTI